MSLCVYARIADICLSEEELTKILKQYSIFSDNNIYVSLIDKTHSPYNVYEYNCCEEKYKYNQVVIFELDKERLTADAIPSIINFCVELERKVLSSILITSDAHNEICLIQNHEVQYWRDDI